MKPTSSSSDTREQLRLLMSKHTATTTPRPVSSVPASTPVRRAPVVQSLQTQPSPVPTRSAPVLRSPSPEPQPLETPRAAAPRDLATKCTVRLSAAEFAIIDDAILQAHQRVGERLTISDILRIALARVTAAAPIAAKEIATLRASDGRRTKLHGQ